MIKYATFWCIFFLSSPPLKGYYPQYIELYKQITQNPSSALCTKYSTLGKKDIIIHNMCHIFSEYHRCTHNNADMCSQKMQKAYYPLITFMKKISVQNNKLVHNTTLGDRIQTLCVLSLQSSHAIPQVHLLHRACRRGHWIPSVIPKYTPKAPHTK